MVETVGFIDLTPLLPSEGRRAVSRSSIAAKLQRSWWPEIRRDFFSVSSQAEATQRSAMS